MSKPEYRKTAGKPSPPSKEYVSKEIAADRLGLSVRRVLELSARGLLKRRTVRDPVTKREQTVFLAADVDRVIDGQRRAVAYRVGAAEVAALPPPPASSAPPPPNTTWLTLEEAAAYCGLPVSYIQKQIDAGCLTFIDVGPRPGGRYRVTRRDLDMISGGRRAKSNGEC